MVGWNLKEGICQNANASEHDFWAATSYLFEVAHKATTYKYCFFKTLLDITAAGGGENISYREVFERFTAIYWELITKYRLNQAYATSRYAISKVEAIIDEFIVAKGLDRNTEFYRICDDYREQLISEVEKLCSNNVVGAFFTSTNCIFYDFSKADRYIRMSKAAIKFCVEYHNTLEALNYYHWAKMLEKINGDTTPKALITKMAVLGKVPIQGKTAYTDCLIAYDEGRRYSLADMIPWTY